MKKRVSATTLILLSTGLLLPVFVIPRVKAETWTVDDDGGGDFSVIQEAVDAAGIGDIVRVLAGFYNEKVVINKSISLVGENKSTTFIDGSGGGTVINVTASNVRIKGFTVRNGQSGIVVFDSYNCTVEGNIAEDNKIRGILISESQNCTVKRNHAIGTQGGYGINVYASQYVLVEENVARDNLWDGIGLLESNNSIVRENTVSSNRYIGIWVEDSSENSIYLNNFFNNSRHVSSNSRANVWDNGVEGNYWSDYAGVDENGDGIGDEPYIVDVDTQQRDSYPLMRPYVNEVYLTVDTEPPIASFTHSSGELLVNETIGFDASGSYDSVGRRAITSYEWDFGDGTTMAGVAVNYAYPDEGNYTVVLTVVDVAGNKGYASIEVQIKLGETGKPPFPILLVGVLIALTTASLGILAFLLRRNRLPFSRVHAWALPF